MNSMIYNPQEEYDSKFKALHSENTQKLFEDLVVASNVNVEENQKTVSQYENFKTSIKKLKRRFNLWRFLRVLMIITLVLIPLVILKITPKIKSLRTEIELSESKADDLLTLAYEQMRPLNDLFSEADALKIIESTIPLISFAPCFSAEQESDMILNYDFSNVQNAEESTVDALAGDYNGNPFLFENKIIHTMGMETYHGYKTIHWTETYRDSEGRTRRRTRSQTLHATVVKPKPFYSTQVILNYCAQGGPELSFTRDATHLERKSEKEIDKYIKKGEKKLKDLTDKAIKDNSDFVSMSNSDFEVLFDALDRTNEVQFRTLFTPLAQTNMVDIIRSQSGYGDDFNFIKNKRTNKIITQHSQGRMLNLHPSFYASYSFDIIKETFLAQNEKFFKDIYFDFAPLWAIPIYQERPVHSLKPIPDHSQKYSCKECESLANRMDSVHVAHPMSKTQAILKSSFVRSNNNADEICVSAYSYDIMPQIDFVSVHGGDGRWHSVPVHWDLYVPLEESNRFFVGPREIAKNKTIFAQRNDLCIFN